MPRILILAVNLESLADPNARRREQLKKQLVAPV
jgi:hypothetical protein